jgi:hypothetical protein
VVDRGCEGTTRHLAWQIYRALGSGAGRDNKVRWIEIREAIGSWFRQYFNFN